MSSILFAQRSYGGKSGTWFRKRKLNEGTASNATSSSSSLQLVSRNEQNGFSCQPSVSRPLETPGARSSVLLGWDDVRCRPVYKNKDEVVSRKKRSPENEIPTGAYLRKTTVQVSDKSNRVQVQTHQGFPFKKERRSYGRPRKERKLSKGGHDTEQGTVEASSEFLTATFISRSDFGNAGRASMQKEADSYDSVFDCQDGKTAEEIQGTKPKISCRTSRRGAAQSVSFNTSLSVAKDFFRRIDTQELTVSAEPSSSPRHNNTKAIGRSTRPVSWSTTRVLAEEYVEYAASCETFAVLPLPKASYITNRSSFFRSDEVYDGFLDE